MELHPTDTNGTRPPLCCSVFRQLPLSHFPCFSMVDTTLRWDADRDRLPTTCVLATRHVAALEACTGIGYRRYCHSPYSEQRFAHRSSIMLPVKDGRESLNMADLLATEHPISHASARLHRTNTLVWRWKLSVRKNKIRCVSEAKQSSNGNDKQR